MVESQRAFPEVTWLTVVRGLQVQSMLFGVVFDAFVLLLCVWHCEFVVNALNQLVQLMKQEMLLGNASDDSSIGNWGGSSHSGL